MTHPWEQLEPLEAKILLNLSPSIAFDAIALGEELAVPPGEVRNIMTKLRRDGWPIVGSNKKGWTLKWERERLVHQRMLQSLSLRFDRVYA